MFENKKCKDCGQKIKDDWNFCPNCGEELRDELSEENIFGSIEDEFKRIDKMFASDFDFPKFDMKMPKKSNGVNIIIRSGTGMRPQVEVKTSGGYKQLEPEIKRNLGIASAPVKEIKSLRSISRIAEEPETDIKNEGSKQIIQIKLPDIKNLSDVEVKKLEQSLEIKAFGKDKTYFKLIPIPSNSNIVKKEFKNENLKIEIER